MRNVWKKILFPSAVAVSIPLIIILLIKVTPKPPIAEMKYARERISMAGKNKADIYSRKLFLTARSYYDSAMVHWQKENKRFLYFREYDKVAMFAKLSSKKAGEARDNSISNSSNLKIKLKEKINTLNDLISEINVLFTSYPLTLEIRNRISKGKMLLKEAEIEYKNGQYLRASTKISDSEYLLKASYDNASADLKNYFKSYPTWKNWVDKTINDSKKNRDYSIIIDKYSRKLYIYFNGTIKYQYEAELGTNWVGGKKVKGDKATPEGMYKIIKKFEKSKTKYYKALLLDYPNDKDLEKFKSERINGSIPSSAKIGGLIEIHGNGGKGIDWTDGCIAITDKEMDLVFSIAKEGTPVTIVGSLVELKDVLDK
jgi:hypothetical protein